MAYTTNPKMPKARMEAVRLVKYRGWSMRRVARHVGVEPSTVSRWCRDPYGTGWMPIPTREATPKRSPRALPAETVDAIITERIGRRRCAEHVHQALKKKGVEVSLSSVKRTLDRCHLIKKRSPWKRPHDYTERPKPEYSGALVEMDTIHIITAEGRIYVYTLIDLYSRWAYAEIALKIGAEQSAAFVKRAKQAAIFRFELIQTDHGPEFSTRFTHRLLSMGIRHRHSRVRQKDDQAHIERFNRTIQEECLDRTTHTVADFKAALKVYMPWYNGERSHMGINYQTPLEVLRRC
ncbi:MAG: DDE-type integrase/transposase/recombinase [Patescibacteria group bacterium]|nr:DDE-type integrase/transposase/recombinase [Patescibacteria group bacterium]